MILNGMLKVAFKKTLVVGDTVIFRNVTDDKDVVTGTVIHATSKTFTVTRKGADLPTTYLHNGVCLKFMESSQVKVSTRYTVDFEATYKHHARKFIKRMKGLM